MYQFGQQPDEVALGNILRTIAAVSTATTVNLATTDLVVKCATNTAALTLNLPHPARMMNKTVTVYGIDTQTHNITVTGQDMTNKVMDCGSSAGARHKALFYSDGCSWFYVCEEILAA